MNPAEPEFYPERTVEVYLEYKNLDALLKKCQRIMIVPNNGKIQIECYPCI